VAVMPLADADVRAGSQISEHVIAEGESTTFLEMSPSINDEAIIPAPMKPIARGVDEGADDMISFS